MPLRIERPIAFLDIQSTGLDPKTARAVRISILKVTPDGSERVRTALVNPGVPIPPGATAVHGVSDEDVADAPSFGAYARSLADHLADCDIAGFGVARFGLPLLAEEFRRAGVDFSMDGRAVIDGLAIFHRMEPRDFAAAYRRYTGRAVPDEQDADFRVRAAREIVEGQLAAYPELPEDPGALDRFLNAPGSNAVDPAGRYAWSEAGEALMAFGKYRGHRLADVASSDPGYLEWVAGRPDFSAEVRDIARAALRGEFPKRTPDAPGA